MKAGKLLLGDAVSDRIAAGTTAFGVCIVFLQAVGIHGTKKVLKEKNMEADRRGFSCPEPMMPVVPALKIDPEKVAVLISGAHTAVKVRDYAMEHGYRVSESGNRFDYLSAPEK